MAVKLCTANGFCIRCNGTIEDALKVVNNGRGGFICCGDACIRCTDVSTIDTVELKAPEDDDDDKRQPVLWVEGEEEGLTFGG